MVAYLDEEVEVEFGGGHEVEAVLELVELAVKMLRSLANNVVELSAAVEPPSKALFFFVVALVRSVDEVKQTE